RMSDTPRTPNIPLDQSPVTWGPVVVSRDQFWDPLRPPLDIDLWATDPELRYCRHWRDIVRRARNTDRPVVFATRDLSLDGIHGIWTPVCHTDADTPQLPVRGKQWYAAGQILLMPPTDEAEALLLDESLRRLSRGGKAWKRHDPTWRWFRNESAW